MLADPLLKKNRKKILQIAARHGAYNVRVFGSRVRAEAVQGSDLDLLVEVGPNRSQWFPAGLIADLQDLLGCEVDVVTANSIHWYIRQQVIEAAQPL